jgi:pyrroloquinoline quinone biosynthesis protein B
LAWAGDPRVVARTQSSVAVSVDGVEWTLLNASPDLRQQILSCRALHPSGGARSSPIRNVVLTNGDVDHLAGLINLREQQPFNLYGSGATLALVAPGTVFGVLNPAVVTKHRFELGQAMTLPGGLIVTPFAVPGKAPLFLEGDAPTIGEENENTIGLEIAYGGKRAIYAPGCARVTPDLLRRLEGADALFFDGTTFTDDEMPALGLSPKTAARMGHLAISGEAGSLKALAGVTVGRKIYIHINNTNPILVAGSEARQSVERAGWSVAYDGMELEL